MLVFCLFPNTSTNFNTSTNDITFVALPETFTTIHCCESIDIVKDLIN